MRPAKLIFLLLTLPALVCAEELGVEATNGTHILGHRCGERTLPHVGMSNTLLSQKPFCDHLGGSEAEVYGRLVKGRTERGEEIIAVAGLVAQFGNSNDHGVGSNEKASLTDELLRGLGETDPIIAMRFDNFPKFWKNRKIAFINPVEHKVYVGRLVDHGPGYFVTDKNGDRKLLPERMADIAPLMWRGLNLQMNRGPAPLIAVLVSDDTPLGPMEEHEEVKDDLERLLQAFPEDCMERDSSFAPIMSALKDLPDEIKSVSVTPPKEVSVKEFVIQRSKASEQIVVIPLSPAEKTAAPIPRYKPGPLQREHEQILVRAVSPRE